jgi:hypothetical protein
MTALDDMVGTVGNDKTHVPWHVRDPFCYSVGRLSMTITAKMSLEAG